MSELQIRPTVATDLTRLMGIDHSMISDAVWQLEVRRNTGQVAVTFREVRLPREIQVPYPHNHFALADDWVNRSMMYTAITSGEPVGYISLLERGTASTVWVLDLAIDVKYRRRGVAVALLASAQAWAESRAHRRLILEVQSKNVPAIRLAQKSGFEFSGYNDQYYLNKDVALYFAKVLK
ncbi:MAG: GNAT family N-acetyltransferase [Anaerolineales bacterium]